MNISEILVSKGINPSKNILKVTSAECGLGELIETAE